MARKVGITRDDILDVAQRLLQTRGYNGFSYKDVAGTVGIRSASLHHHFPVKADLGVALVVRYRRRFSEELDAIARTTANARERLDNIAALFRRTLDLDDSLCLCGMLGAELATLPEPVKIEVDGFFRENEAWLAAVFANGRETGCLGFAGAPEEQAVLFLAALQGAMIVARGTRDRHCFDIAVAALLRQIESSARDRVSH